MGRPILIDQHCVQNSEVYLLGRENRPSVPPPSPPSPLSPSSTPPTGPIEQLCLGDAASPGEGPIDARTRQRRAGAVHVLNTEATALRKLTHLYETDPTTAAGFSAAVEVVTMGHQGRRGKAVFIGVGKSGYICQKLVATFNSLGLEATFLHPTEALHGDMGMIGPHDIIVFITFSGKTPELLLLLPHIDPSLPVIILTSHTRPEDCELIRERPGMILLPAPIHEPETASFGVSAPTTSTTMALAVGDALAVVAAQEVHTSVSSVFSRNHPGGAIGASFRKPQRVRDLAIPLRNISALPSPLADLRGADVLRAAYDSVTGWVSFSGRIACPSRIRQLTGQDLAKSLAELEWLGADRTELITISADTRITQAMDWIADLRSNVDDRCEDHSILAIVEDQMVLGLLEVGQLLKWNG